MKHRDKAHRRQAYTLVEVIVVSTIFLLVTTGVATFMVDSSRSMFWVAKKSQISKDVRIFTMRITQETLGANVGYVYADYATTNRNRPIHRRGSGETGDCLALIHMVPYPNIDDAKHYSKIIAYYRQADESGRGPVYRVEKEFHPPAHINPAVSFETFFRQHFPNHTDLNSEIVLELSRGLSNGNLFHNLGNNTFVINGEIIHGNAVQEVTNTYNLTISPRG